MVGQVVGQVFTRVNLGWMEELVDSVEPCDFIELVVMAKVKVVVVVSIVAEVSLEAKDEVEA